MKMVEQFAVNPYLTIKRIAETFRVAYSTADRGIKKLLNKNIITQVSGNKCDKVYCATKILAILEEPAKIHSDPEKG